MGSIKATPYKVPAEHICTYPCSFEKSPMTLKCKFVEETAAPPFSHVLNVTLLKSAQQAWWAEKRRMWKKPSEAAFGHI